MTEHTTEFVTPDEEIYNLLHDWPLHGTATGIDGKPYLTSGDCSDFTTAIESIIAARVANALTPTNRLLDRITALADRWDSELGDREIGGQQAAAAVEGLLFDEETGENIHGEDS